MTTPDKAKKTAAKPTVKAPKEKPPAAFVPRVRGPNEAGPRTSNVMTGTWVPPSMEPARAGGNDHLDVKSLTR